MKIKYGHQGKILGKVPGIYLAVRNLVYVVLNPLFSKSSYSCVHCSNTCYTDTVLVRAGRPHATDAFDGSEMLPSRCEPLVCVCLAVTS